MAERTEWLRGGRHLRLALMALTAMLVVAAVVTGVAGLAYRSSFDTALSLTRRLGWAETASRLAPWVEPFRNRDAVMAGWVSGRNLLESGDYSRAVETLRVAAYRQRVADPQLVALYKRAQEIEALATTRKAHLQHGHEGPGSSLRPEDVER